MKTSTIIYKNLRQRALSTSLTALSIALGVALVTAITCLRQQAQDTFTSVAASYELIVGAKGSPLQLVLNTVYHLDVPVGNIPYGYYQQLKNDPRVAYALPFALGDSYRGFRLVGTEPEYFSLLELKGGQKLSFQAGKAFEKDYEAVVGSLAAQRAGLTVGQKFIARHGVEDTSVAEEHEEHPVTVVGILTETGTPLDRVIFISLGSVNEIHEEAKKDAAASTDLMSQLNALSSPPPPGTAAGTPTGVAPIPGLPSASNDSKLKEVTAIIIKLKTPPFMFQMQREINKGPVAQAAFPGVQMQSLFSNIIGPLNRLLLVISALVVVVAGVSILVAIYNSLNERRREIAVMRALGARRLTIFKWLILEAGIVAGLGAIGGVILGHLALLGLNGFANRVGGIQVSAWKAINLGDIFDTVPKFLAAVPGETAIVLAAILLGAVMGILPAALAYRTNVSENLTS